MILEAFDRQFELVNEDKAARAISGTLGRNAEMVGGVGEDASGEAKLAEYDRLGGGIKLDGDRVKPGTFYDFKARKPVAEPVVMLEFNINGKLTHVSADEPLPPVIRAAKEAEQGNVGEEATEDAADEGDAPATTSKAKPRAKPKAKPTTDEDDED